MSIALFAISDLISPLAGLARWLLPNTQKSLLLARTSGQPGAVTQDALSQKTSANEASSPKQQQGMQSRLLRVERVLESGQSPGQVGRMVISGRMADVCAELDRLAKRAAALH